MTRGDYNSGDDYVLEYGELRFTFNERDFVGRVHHAAQVAGLLAGPLEGDDEEELLADLEALVHFAVNGEPPNPPLSRLAVHLTRHWTALERPRRAIGANEDAADGGLAHWLRRIVFRQAWIDQRILEGEIEPKAIANRAAVPAGGGDVVRFAYVETAAPHREIPAPVPSYADVAFPE